MNTVLSNITVSVTELKRDFASILKQADGRRRNNRTIGDDRLSEILRIIHIGKYSDGNMYLVRRKIYQSGSIEIYRKSCQGEKTDSQRDQNSDFGFCRSIFCVIENS